MNKDRIQVEVTVTCIGATAEDIHSRLTSLLNKYRGTFFDDLHDPVLERSKPTPLNKLTGVTPQVERSSVRFKLMDLDPAAIDEFADILSDRMVTDVDAVIHRGDRVEAISIEPRRYIVEETLKEVSRGR